METPTIGRAWTPSFMVVIKRTYTLESTLTQTKLLLHLAPQMMIKNGNGTATGANFTALTTALPLSISQIQLMLVYVLMIVNTDIPGVIMVTNVTMPIMSTESVTPNLKVSGTKVPRLHTSASMPSGAQPSPLDLTPLSG